MRRADGDTVVFAVSLESQRTTVNQLLVIELVVGVLILLLVGAVGRVVVRIGLRPLTRMEGTAAEIAAGNVDLRVADTDPRTETGQLGRTVNTMLERLGQAMRDRESSEHRLRRFVADASHELRTPLTSIRGFAELYRHGSGPRDPGVEQTLRRIEGEAQRMGVLVEDLLVLARLDRERALDLSEVDVVALVRDVVQDAHARYPQRSITTELDGFADGQVRVVGDEHRLYQVVSNLVANALIHAPATARVRVRVGSGIAGPTRPDVVAVGRELAPCAAVAFVEVHDDGPGIESEHLPLLFDRFYRAGVSRSSGGTGLGLAIAAALVETHDGRIEVTSTSDGGTTFRVLLPRSGPAGA